MSLLNKSGLELVLDLINRDNNIVPPLTFDEVVFEAPVKLVVNEGIRNTSMRVLPAPGSKLRNEKTVKYWRIYLDRIMTAEERVFPGLGITNTRDLVELINQRYNLAMDHNDVVYEPIDTTTLPIEYTIKATDFSYAYVGEVTVTLDSNLTNLSSVLTERRVVDFLGRTELTNEFGNLAVSTDGLFQVANTTITDTNFVKIDNAEFELGFGVIKGSDINLGNEAILPVNNLYDVAIAPNENWNVVLSLSMLDLTRMAPAGVIVDNYLVRVTLNWGNYAPMILDLVWDNNTGTYGWSINRSTPGAFPLIEDKTNHRLVSYLEMKELLSVAFATQPPATDWASLGNFDIHVTAIPLSAVYIKPIEPTFTVSVVAE